MQVDLDAVQSALVASHTARDADLHAKQARFERYAERKMQRLQREADNSKLTLFRVLSKSLNVTIPQGAAVGMKSDGLACLMWQDAPLPKAADDNEGHAGEITVMPKNGVPVGASH